MGEPCARGESRRSARLLSGWGRATASRAEVLQPRAAVEVETLVSTRSPLIARGLGRSYGDAAQCAGGTVVDMTGLCAVGPLQERTGLVEVDGGTSLDRLMRRTIPRGWFLPVWPGTRQVTVGGAIAADIHGKNHHRDGSFAQHVSRLTLATPTGTYELTPERDPELFWATAGGMGLTGVVTRATISMIPVETSWMSVDTDRFDDLDEAMAAMQQADADHRYSVAWLDCMAPGRHAGRAVMTAGDHAKGSELPARLARKALALPRSRALRIPFTPTHGLLNPLAVTAFNETWFWKAPRRERGRICSMGSFFHPLDAVANWNVLYGRGGFVQYQFVVGDTASELVAGVIGELRSARVPIFLAVLKRFGGSSPGLLSFPMPGWTLALDLPSRAPGLPDVLRRLDHKIAESGGRVYLAKDARLSPDLLEVMYPKLGDLAHVRDRVDPAGVLASDLSRRLGITDAPAHAGLRKMTAAEGSNSQKR